MRSLKYFVLAAGLAVSTASAQPLVRVHVLSDRPAMSFDLLEKAGFEPRFVAGGVEVIAATADLEQLRQWGMDPVVVERSRPLEEILRERRALDAKAGGAGTPEKADYMRLADIVATMEAMAAAHPDICRVVDLTVELGAPVTHEGRHIVAMRITDNVNIDEDEPASLIVSNHHAREIVTPVIALKAMEELTSNYDTDPAIAAIVDENDIWIVPTWNPDGYEYVFTTHNMWRKNRRNNNNGTYGVDLNRNYPFGWGLCGASSQTGSETYGGPSAGSEPETQTMMLFSAAEAFSRVADLHSSGREVRYGYGCWTHPWTGFMLNEARDLSVASGYGGSIRNSCCLGGDFAYHIAESGAYAFLWETASEFQPSYASALNEAEMVWPGLRAMIERPAPLHGHVTTIGGDPIEAEITFQQVGFTHGEYHGSDAAFGRYSAFPMTGVYNVEFTADGYQSQVHTVSIGAASVELDVVMGSDCYADCDPSTGPGVLDVFDFLCFQDAFVSADPYACECDTSTGPGVCDVFDFLCFQDSFVAGCP